MEDRQPNDIEYHLELYPPHRIQEKAHDCDARFRVLAWGRQGGKSTWGNNEGIKKAWENSRRVYWYILPTWSQALVQFRRAQYALSQSIGVIRDISKSELFFQLRSGSYLFYKSGKEFENLRTETLDGVIIDEYRKQHPDLWPRVIRPMLGTTGGWAAFISTTNGFDDFFELFQKGARGEEGWFSLQAPSNCNPLFTEEEMQACRSDMSDAEFRQEILAQFVELNVGKVYPNYTQDHVKDAVPFTNTGELSKHLPIILAPDFNLSPMGWAIGQALQHDFYWVDEIFEEHTDTANAAKKFVEKYFENKWTQKVIVCGDATSQAGQRAAGGKSDYDILFAVLSEAGIQWENRVPQSNPPIKDRVNAVNARLKNAEGSIHMWHHSRCKFVARDFMRLKWKETKGLEIDCGPKRDLGHITDGLGYAVHAMAPVPSINQVGRMRIIGR